MRFKTEQEGLQYIKNKEILDPRSWNQHFKQCMQKIPVVSAENARIMFEQWVHLKRFMFAPEELIALIGEDHRGRKGKINQAKRDHYINTFVDWAEERPRRMAVIIVDAAQRVAANAIASQLNVIGNSETFSGLGLSETGKESATAYGCGWNCSASEYDFLDQQNQPWWRVYDGALMNLKEVLAFEGLKVITPKEPGFLQRAWNWITGK